MCPLPKEYMANIQVVDDIVKKTDALFHEFYGDDETAFIFTSDHGMTPIGNHGDGRQCLPVSILCRDSSLTSHCHVQIPTVHTLP